jgi:hypothetical protein
MISHHIYYQLAIVGLLWLCVMLHYVWPRRGAVSPQPPAEPLPPQRKRQRASEPAPFAGLTQRPHCAACAHAAAHPKPPPPRRPDPMPLTTRRPRVIDTSLQFCPHEESAKAWCSSRRLARVHMCSPYTLHPAPSPPDAGRDTVPSRFRCQSGDCGYRVRRLCTGRYLPAHLRRILLMEQQVWSV